MNMEERIRRINELYHKSQAAGLTEAEKQEQARLRREYVDNIKANIKAQMNNISVEREDGTIEHLGETHGKPSLRREILQKRDAVTQEERRRAALLITERIAGHQWFYGSENLLCFHGYGSEIDTRELLCEALRQGKKVYLPRVEGEELQFYKITSLDQVTEGYKGIPEPAGDTQRYQYTQELAEKTLMIMPGVAFDPEKNRLGYGKGFYDRYLADKKALALRSIGICFQCQMVEQVPAGEQDIRPYQVISV